MPNTLVLMAAGLILASGAALADTGGELSNPSTTGDQAIEHPSTDTPGATPAEQDTREDHGEEVDESALGTMGTGATGTTGGMGATTGTDTIGDRDDTDQ